MKDRQYNGQKIPKGKSEAVIQVSFGHCIVCLSLIYSFWFPLWYLLAIVLSVFHWFTASDFPFGIFWPLYCLYFIDLQLLISTLVSFGHCIVCISLIYSFWFPFWYLLAIVLSVFHWFTASDFPFGIFWPLYCLYFIDLQLLISLLVSFGYCIVCFSLFFCFFQWNTDNTMTKRYQRGNQKL
jgi:uncharacterized membrane protein